MTTVRTIQPPETERVTIYLDGQPLVAYVGDTVAAALMVAGIRPLRQTLRGAAPRSVFCGMGCCFDCVATVDGQRSVRTCMTPVRDGMQVKTQ